MDRENVIEGEYFYRYYNQNCSNGVDQFDNPYPGHTVTIGVLRFPVIRYTPKGVWLETFNGNRFVLLTAYKKFACPTKEEALQSFISRKNREYTLYRNRMEDIERALELAGREKRKLTDSL